LFVAYFTCRAKATKFSTKAVPIRKCEENLKILLGKGASPFQISQDQSIESPLCKKQKNPGQVTYRHGAHAAITS